jgi:hypothetical protein
MKRLLIVLLILGPALLWGQTKNPPIEVGVLRFFGDEEPINDLFWQAVIEDTKKMPRFTPLSVGMTQEEANEFLPDEPPPAKWIDDRQYVLTGALYPDADAGQQHLQIWLWDMKAPALVHTDEMVCDNFSDGREYVSYLADWVFSHVPEQVTYDPDKVITVVVEREVPGPEVVVELPAPVEPELWRSRRFYVNVGLGVDSGHFVGQETSQIQTGILQPTAMAGIEWHFWKYLALEIDPLRPRSLNDGRDTSLSLAFPVLVKGVFRPRIFLVEPYVGMAYELGIGDSVPPLSGQMGVQLGVQAAKESAWMLDMGFSMSMGGAYHAQGKPYSLLHIYLMIGYKLGFMDR